MPTTPPPSGSPYTSLFGGSSTEGISQPQTNATAGTAQALGLNSVPVSQNAPSKPTAAPAAAPESLLPNGGIASELVPAADPSQSSGPSSVGSTGAGAHIVGSSGAYFDSSGNLVEQAQPFQNVQGVVGGNMNTEGPATSTVSTSVNPQTGVYNNGMPGTLNAPIPLPQPTTFSNYNPATGVYNNGAPGPVNPSVAQQQASVGTTTPPPAITSGATPLDYTTFGNGAQVAFSSTNPNQFTLTETIDGNNYVFIGAIPVTMLTSTQVAKNAAVDASWGTLQGAYSQVAPLNNTGATINLSTDTGSGVVTPKAVIAQSLSSPGTPLTFAQGTPITFSVPSGGSVPLTISAPTLITDSATLSSQGLSSPTIFLPTGWTTSNGNVYDSNGTLTAAEAQQYADALQQLYFITPASQAPQGSEGLQNPLLNTLNWAQVLESSGNPQIGVQLADIASFMPYVSLSKVAHQLQTSPLPSASSFVQSAPTSVSLSGGASGQNTSQSQALAMQGTGQQTQQLSGPSQSLLNGAYSYLNPIANSYNPGSLNLGLLTSGLASLGQTGIQIANEFTNPQNLASSAKALYNGPGNIISNPGQILSTPQEVGQIGAERGNPYAEQELLALEALPLSVATGVAEPGMLLSNIAQGAAGFPLYTGISDVLNGKPITLQQLFGSAIQGAQLAGIAGPILSKIFSVTPGLNTLYSKIGALPTALRLPAEQGLNAALGVGFQNAFTLGTGQGLATPSEDIAAGLTSAILPFAGKALSQFGPRIVSYNPDGLTSEQLANAQAQGIDPNDVSNPERATGLVLKIGAKDIPLINYVNDAGVRSIGLGTPSFDDPAVLGTPSSQNNMNNIVSDFANQVVAKTLDNAVDSGLISQDFAKHYQEGIAQVKASMALAKEIPAPSQLTLSMDKSLYSDDEIANMKQVLTDLTGSYKVYGTASAGIDLADVYAQAGDQLFRGAHDIDMQSIPLSSANPTADAQAAARTMGQAYEVNPEDPAVVQRISDGQKVFDFKDSGSAPIEGQPPIPKTEFGMQHSQPIVIEGIPVAPVQDSILDKAFSAYTFRIDPDTGELNIEPSPARSTVAKSDLADLYALQRAVYVATGNDPTPIDAQAIRAQDLGFLPEGAYEAATSNPNILQTAQSMAIQSTIPSTPMPSAALSGIGSTPSSIQSLVPPPPQMTSQIMSQPSVLNSGNTDPISNALEQQLYLGINNPSSPQINGLPYSSAVINSLAASQAQEQYQSYVNSLIYQQLISSGLSPSAALSAYQNYLSMVNSAAASVSASQSPNSPSLSMASAASSSSLSPSSTLSPSPYASLSPYDAYSSAFPSPYSYSPYAYSPQSPYPYTPGPTKKKSPVPSLFTGAASVPMRMGNAYNAKVPGSAQQYMPSIISSLFPSSQAGGISNLNSPLRGISVRPIGLEQEALA